VFVSVHACFDRRQASQGPAIWLAILALGAANPALPSNHGLPARAKRRVGERLSLALRAPDVHVQAPARLGDTLLQCIRGTLKRHENTLLQIRFMNDE